MVLQPTGFRQIEAETSTDPITVHSIHFYIRWMAWKEKQNSSHCQTSTGNQHDELSTDNGLLMKGP